MDTTLTSIIHTARWLGLVAVLAALSIPLLAALWPLIPVAVAAAASTFAAGTWLASLRSAA